MIKFICRYVYSFRGLLLSLLKWVQSKALLWRMTLLRTLPDVLRIVIFLHSGKWNGNYPQPCMSSGNCSTYFFLMMISSALWSSASHKCRSSAIDWRGPLCSCLGLLCTTNSSCLGLPNLWALIHLMRLQDFLCIPLPCIAACKLPPDSQLGHHRALLICFSSFRDPSPTLPAVQCLLILFFFK